MALARPTSVKENPDLLILDFGLKTTKKIGNGLEILLSAYK